MLRDNLVGLIEPMCTSAGVDPLALCLARQMSSDDRPPCLENPRPEGAESTLTGKRPSPFHAEPRQEMIRGRASGYLSLARCRIISMSASFIDSRKSQCSKKRLHPSSTLHK